MGIPVSDLSMVPPSLVEAASTPEPVSLVCIESPEVPRPIGTGDDWFVIPVRRTLTSSSSLPIRAEHALRDGSFVVTDALFKRILTFAEMQPTLDAFASSSSAKCDRYFTIQDDAFRHSWSDEILWLAPPFHLMDDVVRKICDDKAAGILLHPLRRDERWFHDLQDVAVTWWDVPPSLGLIATPCGLDIPPHPSYALRVLVFNASGYVQPMHTRGKTPKNLIDAPIDWEFPSVDDIAQLRSVIASTSQHADAAPLVERIQHYFHAQLHEPKLARDVNPSIRGPFGVAKIELKDTGRPLARKPFRTLGLREEALKVIIDKYLDRGWIQPSKSEWAAQAFVVPKPDSADHKKQWIMVVDYRYLNSQTKDDPFHLPLIENLIGKQDENRLWSILDLEDVSIRCTWIQRAGI